MFRGRLLGLARGWDAGVGPRALLACPSGERHDLGLLAFGIALRGHGWRITYLGADTPPESLQQSIAALGPSAVILAVTVTADAQAVGDGLPGRSAGRDRRSRRDTPTRSETGSGCARL
jgi:hypothetical protein